MDHFIRKWLHENISKQHSIYSVTIVKWLYDEYFWTIIYFTMFCHVSTDDWL